MPLLRTSIRYFLTLALPLLLVLGSVRLLLSYEFLRFEYHRLGFPSDSYGFSTADRLEYGPLAISYLFNSEPIDFLATLRLPLDKCWQPLPGATDCAMFNARELTHLRDVKQIIRVAFPLGIACTILATALIVLGLSKDNYRADIRIGLRRGCYLALALIAGLATLAVGAWDLAFDNFHEIFFAEGTWRFPYSDTLIRLYPEQLFLDAALIIALLTSLGAILILFLLARRGSTLLD